MSRKKENECDICKIPIFERNNYYYGKLLTVRDYEDEQCYFNEKRWLINRMVNGWGVVCGLDVERIPISKGPCEEIKYDETKVLVKPGLAIDCCGREILVCKDVEVSLPLDESECPSEETEKVECPEEPEKPECPEKAEYAKEQNKSATVQHTEQKQDTGSKEVPEQGAIKKEYVICLKYHECKTEQVNLPSITCDEKERCEFNRIRDSFEIYAKPISEVDIEKPYGMYCPQDNKDDNCKTKHAYICKELIEGCPECPECTCVVLAVVYVSFDKDGKPTLNEIDKCSKRKLIYNNSLLYDLIHCYHKDAPNIVHINWKHNHSYPWCEFKSRMLIKVDDCGNIIEKGEGLIIKFNRKVIPDTLNECTFFVDVLVLDKNDYVHRATRIPIEKEIDPDKNPEFCFIPHHKWFGDTIDCDSDFRERGGKVMITLKGDFILDECNIALDGNFIGGKLPSGNGVEGCDFVSWFFVEPDI